MLIRERVQSRSVSHDAPDRTDMLCTLDVGQQRVAAADQVARVFQAWRFGARALVKRRLHDAGGNDPAVIEIEELRNDTASTLVQLLRRLPLGDEHQDARPRPRPHRAVFERARSRGAVLALTSLANGYVSLVIRVGVSNQKATDSRGEDVVEMTEMNVVGVPRVEEVLYCQRREAPGIGI